MGQMDHRAFIEALTKRFPDAAAEIDPDIDGGLLHLEMGGFRRFTQDAIDRRNRELVIHCFQFADSVLANADDVVKNAVYVSYLEHLDFEGDRKYAKELMTSALRAGWADITKYMAQFCQDPKASKDKRGKKPKRPSRRDGRRRG